jgi:hypothetical protein
MASTLQLAARRAPHFARISALKAPSTLGPRFYARKTVKKTIPPIPHSTPANEQKMHHEVREGSVAINIPSNPPGGGGGALPLTSSPLLGAALTTIIGLGIGESSIQFCGRGCSAMRSLLIARVVQFLAAELHTLHGTREGF